jgi:uncharacterized protein (DUF2267 family)
MDAGRFIALVEERAHLDPRSAERAVDATLRTLAERITQKEAHDLAAQLPGPLQRPLLEAKAERELFDAADFVRRVAEREEVAPVEARLHVHATLVTLREAVSPGELEDVLALLGQDYLDLFAPDYPERVPDVRDDAYVEFGLTPEELETRFTEELARQTGFDDSEIGAIARVFSEILVEDHERMRVQLERAGVRLQRHTIV